MLLRTLRAYSQLRGQVTQSLSLELGHKLCPSATGGGRVPLVPNTCPAREEPMADHPAASVNCQMIQTSKQTTQLKHMGKEPEEMPLQKKDMEMANQFTGEGGVFSITN